MRTQPLLVRQDAPGDCPGAPVVLPLAHPAAAALPPSAPPAHKHSNAGAVQLCAPLNSDV